MNKARLSRALFFFLSLLLVLTHFNFVSAPGGGSFAPEKKVLEIELTDNGKTHDELTEDMWRFQIGEDYYVVQPDISAEEVEIKFFRAESQEIDEASTYEPIRWFVLTEGEEKEADIDGDKINDVFVRVEEINFKSGSDSEVDLYLKLINSDVDPVTNLVETEIQEEILDLDSAVYAEKEKIVLNNVQETDSSEITFFQKIGVWFKELC